MDTAFELLEALTSNDEAQVEYAKARISSSNTHAIHLAIAVAMDEDFDCNTFTKFCRIIYKLHIVDKIAPYLLRLYSTSTHIQIKMLLLLTLTQGGKGNQQIETFLWNNFWEIYSSFLVNPWLIVPIVEVVGTTEYIAIEERIKLLTQIYNNHGRDLAVAALNSLASLGEAAHAIIPVLVRDLKHSARVYSSFARAIAKSISPFQIASALAEIGTDEAIEGLLEALVIAIKYGETNQESSTVANSIVDILRSTDHAMAVESVEAWMNEQSE